jgi:hypothetical protein
LSRGSWEGAWHCHWRNLCSCFSEGKLRSCNCSAFLCLWLGLCLSHREELPVTCAFWQVHSFYPFPHSMVIYPFQFKFQIQLPLPQADT